MEIDFDFSNVCFEDAVIGFDSFYGSFIPNGGVDARAVWTADFNGLNHREGEL